MSKFKTLAVATAIAMSSMVATGANAAINVDGSFEGATVIPKDNSPGVAAAPCTTSYCYRKGAASTLAGHYQNIVFGGNGTVTAANGSAFGFANAPTGNTVAVLQGSAAVITTKIYGLILGAVYQVVFSAQGRPQQNGLNPISVSVGGGGSRPSGQALGTFSPSTAGFQDYTTATFKFVGGASNALTFSGLGTTPGADVSTAIDNVRVTLISAPTPEPEAYLSMILGVGLAGFVARRRAKKAAATA